MLLIIGIALIIAGKHAEARLPDLSKIRVTHCLANALKILAEEGISPPSRGLLRLLQYNLKFPEMSPELSSSLAELETRLHAMGIKAAKIRRANREMIEIFPGNASVYNRHVRTLQEKYGVEHVIFDPIGLSADGAYGSYSKQTKTLRVWGESLLTGKPDPIGLHEATHVVRPALLAQGKVSDPFIARAFANEGLPGPVNDLYYEYMHFEEVKTHALDFSILSKQLLDAWRTAGAREFYETLITRTARKAEISKVLCQRVMGLADAFAPAMELMKRRIGNSHSEHFEVAIPTESGPLKRLELLVVPQKAGEPTPVWIFRLQKLTGHSRFETQYELRIPVAEGPSTMSERLGRLISQLDEAKRLAGAQHDQLIPLEKLLLEVKSAAAQGDSRGEVELMEKFAQEIRARKQ